MPGKWISLAVVALAIGIYFFVYTSDNFEPESIRGKRVLITGASSGIGEELAYAYSRLGASVLLTARRADLLERVATKCKTLGARRAEHVPADMARPEDRERILLEVEKRLGGLDHLILNHAIFIAGPFVASSENLTSLQRDLDVNFVSYAHLAAKSVKMLSMSEDGSFGRIGVVSSFATMSPPPMLSSYTADKHALHGFFDSWRWELSMAKTPVSITLCILGYIRTDAADKLVAETYPGMLAVYPTPPSAAETAVVIMKAVTRGVREITYPKWLVWVNLVLRAFAPESMHGYMASQLS